MDIKNFLIIENNLEIIYFSLTSQNLSLKILSKNKVFR